MRANANAWSAVALAVIAASSLVPWPGTGAAAQSPSAGEPAPAFLLRAGSKWADEIDGTLARVALRASLLVPSGQDAKAFLESICADDAPDYEMAPQQPAKKGMTILVSPCVRVRRNVKVQVTAGDTLYGLVARSVPSVTSSPFVKVISKSGQTQTIDVSTSNRTILPGETVLLPEIPIWTNVVANPTQAPDRAALVSALAAALRCGKLDPETCLTRRGVELLDRASAKPADTPRDEARARIPYVDSQRSASAMASRSLRFEADRRLEARIAVTAAAKAANMTAAKDATLAPPPPPPPLPNTEAAPANQTTVPVSKKQWPYDAELVAAILRRSADKMSLGAIIGVADGGLANKAGGPLSPDHFAPGPEALETPDPENPEPDGADNDSNSFVDDLFNAGIARRQELMGTGDASLCKDTSPPFSKWPTEAFRAASHGAIVSGLAMGAPIRAVAPTLAAVLPRLVFFRLVGSACDENASFNVAAAEMVHGFDYLDARGANIINMSYKIDQDVERFTNHILKVLPQRDKLLILPAGNGNAGSLDDSPICPACLGHDSSDRGSTAAKRTIVVGEAVRELRRAPNTNYGRDTVKLFAPADPSGVMNVASLHASVEEASTSYAAPYVTLAAAIIRSYGGPAISYVDLRDRLEAATWPLDDPDSESAKTGVGVVDLVKAAAVRDQAVEVKELEDGVLVRRTYVGVFKGLLKEINVCPGTAVLTAGVHAIRLNDPGPDGARTIRAYSRSIDPTTKRRKVALIPGCRPSGDLTIRTVFDEEKTFRLADVTHIQLRWLLQ